MIPVVEHGQIGGVPVLRADAASGRYMAALIFRVGRFDEPLPLAGITHMVEHLTFAGKPRADYHFNASVSGCYTSFHMETADLGDIRDFVDTVCRGLAADHATVIDRERLVLRTEAASRGGAGALGVCLGERYGATGPGISNYPEFGLRNVSWQDIAAWRRSWFTADNAVLCIGGAVPGGLRVDLPPGMPPAAPALRPLPLTLPAFTTAARGGIGLSLVGPRSAGTQVTVDVLQRRLTQVLRHEHGLTYDVRVAAEELSRDLVHHWMTADALPEQLPMAAHSMFTVFESLAAGGCDPTEIKDFVRRMADAYASPAGPAIALQSQARALLSGRPPRELAEHLHMAEQVTPADVARTMRTLHDQMIVAVPGALPAVRGRMGPLPAWSAGTVAGKERKSVDSDATLTVGDDGVMLTDNAGRHVTVRYDAVAALLRWNDGRQTLVGDDGFAVQLDPDEWPGGQKVLDSVAARVRTGAVVEIGEAGSPRPGRGRVTRQGGNGQSRTAPKKRKLSRKQAEVIFYAICAVLVVAGIVAFAAGAAQGAWLAGIAAVSLGRVLVRSTARRKR